VLDLEHFALSDTGRLREQNQDFLAASVPGSEAEARARGWLFVLADGAGGEERGEVASRLAVETLIAEFQAAPGAEPHAAVLTRGIQKANTRVYELGNAATTIVSCALRFDRLAVAHVGDSRCYLIRRGSATQLTRDHTVVAEQVRLGILSPEEARDAPNRHLLSRSLGGGLFVNVETGDATLQPGDVLLLCSDGLHGAVPCAEMAEIVTKSPDPETAVRALIALANERDGGDNVSAQCIRVRAVERTGMYRGRPYKLR
jgi:protein phosphatase